MESGESRNFITLYNTYVQIQDEALAELIAGHRVETSGGLKARVINLSIQPATIRWERGNTSNSASGMKIAAQIQAESPAEAEPGEHSIRIVFPELAEFCREFECVFRKDNWRTVSVGIVPVQLHGSRFASIRAQGGVIWKRYRLYVIAVAVIVFALFLQSWLGRRQETS